MWSKIKPILNNIKNECPPFNNFNFTKSFSQAPSFMNLIYNNTDNMKFIAKYHGLKKCAAPGCLTCGIIQIGCTFHYRDIDFQIRSQLHWKSCSVIYALTCVTCDKLCVTCGKLYIEETGSHLNIRKNLHRAYAKNAQIGTLTMPKHCV